MPTSATDTGIAIGEVLNQSIVVTGRTASITTRKVVPWSGVMGRCTVRTPV